MRHHIAIKDNCYEGAIVDEAVIFDLRFLANTTIESLSSKGGENLLVFPHCLNRSFEDLNGHDTIISIKDGKLFTSNYMGFIGRGDVNLSITSRFDSGESNYFMHYMLQKVFALNLFDMQYGRGNNQALDILIYMFPHFLKRALKQGVYKSYRRQAHNDAKVRGSIDVTRHIKHNLPFGGKVAYTTREYSSDNHLTQLIRHTIEHIKARPSNISSVLCNDSDTINAVAQVISVTPNYGKGSLNQIITKNLKPERHPYFTEYALLQKLCLGILRHDKISYSSDSNDQIHGIVFDGAWLWEEYLNTLLDGEGYIHPLNRSRTNPVYIFKDRKDIRYPDFYKEDTVLDAKYKWQYKNANRDDVNQIITYMHCLPATKGGLIYPAKSDYYIDDVSNHYGALSGFGGDFKRYYLNISQEPEFKVFCKEMQCAESKLISDIHSL